MIPILYNIPHCQTPRDNNGKSNQCASAASCGAASSAVACGEVGSSNYRDRVVKQIGNIPQRKPTEANNIGSFATENGAGTKGKMGEGSAGIAAISGGRENNGIRSCEAHDVSVGPQEDRSLPTGKMGEVESAAEEGRIG